MKVNELQSALDLRFELGGHLAPAKGPRGLKRAARKRRRERHAATLRRNAWRSYFESLKPKPEPEEES